MTAPGWVLLLIFSGSNNAGGPVAVPFETEALCRAAIPAMKHETKPSPVTVTFAVCLQTAEHAR